MNPVNFLSRLGIKGATSEGGDPKYFNFLVKLDEDGLIASSLISGSSGSVGDKAANLVFAGPTSGGAATPTFRSLVAGDIPALNYDTAGAAAAAAAASLPLHSKADDVNPAGTSIAAALAGKLGTGGTAADVNPAGTAIAAALANAGGGTPGGSDGDLQINNSGAFGGLTPGTGVADALAQPVNGTGGLQEAFSLGIQDALTGSIQPSAENFFATVGQFSTALPIGNLVPNTGAFTTIDGTSLTLVGATSSAVIVQAAADAGGWNMTLPTTGGTNGYFLQTDGSGSTTWAAASSFDPASPGPIGGTTPGSIAAATITGTSSLTLGTNGGTGGSIILNGATSGTAIISASDTNGGLVMDGGLINTDGFGGVYPRQIYIADGGRIGVNGGANAGTGFRFGDGADGTIVGLFGTLDAQGNNLTSIGSLNALSIGAQTPGYVGANDIAINPGGGSIGVNQAKAVLNSDGSIAFDSGTISTDGFGNLSVNGVVNGFSGLSAGIPGGYNGAVTLFGSSSGSASISVAATGGGISMDGGLINTDGFGNLTASVLYINGGGLLNNGGIYGISCIDSGGAFYPQGGATAIKSNGGSGLSMDNGAITTDGFGNLAVGYDLEVGAGLGSIGNHNSNIYLTNDGGATFANGNTWIDGMDGNIYTVGEVSASGGLVSRGIAGQYAVLNSSGFQAIDSTNANRGFTFDVTGFTLIGDNTTDASAQFHLLFPNTLGNGGVANFQDASGIIAFIEDIQGTGSYGHVNAGFNTLAVIGQSTFDSGTISTDGFGNLTLSHTLAVNGQSTFSGGVNFAASPVHTSNCAITAAEVFFLVNMSASSWTATLPASPSNGEYHTIKNTATNSTGFSLTIGRNGKKIEGAAADATISGSTLFSRTYQYQSATGSWWLTASI